MSLGLPSLQRIVPSTLPRILSDAVLASEDGVYRTIEAAADGLPDDARLRDEFERLIDDVRDEEVQHALRRVLAQLDANADERQSRLKSISVHTSFDAIRVIAKDIASGDLVS